jgi:linoleoyl-CoA desaturase
MKLSFPKESTAFYMDLKALVQDMVNKKGLSHYVRQLWAKLLLYITFYITAYFSMLYADGGYYVVFIILYFLVGLSGILNAFNCSHDAIHGAFSKIKWVNALIFHITFNLQGTNAFLWGKRHKASHHVFPNVDDCDIDIDDNPFLKLSPTHENKWWFKYQHIYATLLYCMYTMQWIFVKDFKYITKKEYANLKNINYPWYQYVALVVWKLFYIWFMIAVPIMITPFTLVQVVIAFIIMHIVISLFFVLTLIMSHLCEQTKFPVADTNGVLPYSYYRHQLEVSMDYSSDSKVAQLLLGGFNTHAAHHLFPNYPHTVYRDITPVIASVTKHYNITYNQLSFLQAVKSHYRFLKKIGGTF